MAAALSDLFVVPYLTSFALSLCTSQHMYIYSKNYVLLKD